MRKAQLSDKDLVIDVLLSGFLHETAGNSLNYFIQGKKNREQRVKILFDYLFHKCIKTGEIYISSNQKGVILVDRSYLRSFSIPLMVKRLHVIISSIGLSHISKIKKRQTLLDQHHKDERFIYPVAMASHHSVRGQGTCVRMIIELLKSNQENSSIYTETTKESSLKIYKRFGFKVNTKSESLGFPMWFLELNQGSN